MNRTVLLKLLFIVILIISLLKISSMLAANSLFSVENDHYLNNDHVVSDSSNSIYGIDIDKFGRIIIGDYRHNQLIVYDSNFKEQLRRYVHSPHGIAVDTRGSIYVTSFKKKRIHKFDKNWKEIPNWDQSLIKQKLIKSPVDLDIDGQNNLIIINDYVDGDIIKTNSSGNFLFSFDTSMFTEKSSFKPHGVTVHDQNKIIYVTCLDFVAVYNLNGVYVEKLDIGKTPFDPPPKLWTLG